MRVGGLIEANHGKSFLCKLIVWMHKVWRVEKHAARYRLAVNATVFLFPSLLVAFFSFFPSFFFFHPHHPRFISSLHCFGGRLPSQGPASSWCWVSAAGQITCRTRCSLRWRVSWQTHRPQAQQRQLVGLILVERKGRLNSRRKRTNRFAPTQALAAFSDAGPVEKNGAGLVVAGSIKSVRRGWIDEWRKKKKKLVSELYALVRWRWRQRGEGK